MKEQTIGQIESNDIEVSKEHAQIIRKKKVLNKLYHDWYKFLLDRIDFLPDGKIIELGSGGGFIKDLNPNIITTEVLDLDTVDMVFSAENMPFVSEELGAIFMIDVLHHIPKCRLFFKEAERTLKPGGAIIMSEPANTPWSRFFYQNFHREDFDPSADWHLSDVTGPLSSANGAIPWIVFNRDRAIFEKEYPELYVEEITLHTPLMYLLAGGLSPVSLIPPFGYSFFKLLEKSISPLNGFLAMFQLIIVRKRE